MRLFNNYARTTDMHIEKKVNLTSHRKQKLTQNGSQT